MVRPVTCPAAEIAATADAPLPPPPVIETAGADVYPDPLETEMPVTAPDETLAVAVAPEPEPPKATSAPEVYPEPVTKERLVTGPPNMIALAAAPEPPPPLKEIVGADV